MNTLVTVGTAAISGDDWGESSPKEIREPHISFYPVSLRAYFGRGVDVAPPRIVRTPGVLGGKPHITGHRISVQDVVIWHKQMGLSVDEIATKYDLSPDDVQAALKYYADHRSEIEESIRASQAFADEMRQHYPSKLKARRDG
jgi:uncharacterized protein (DUF433 family)